jgi:RNA polymerase sigma factor (sigma-70 family)
LNQHLAFAKVDRLEFIFNPKRFLLLKDYAEWFQTTHWSVVLGARSDAAGRDEALEKLCRVYWPAIYTFVRRRGYFPAEAEDLTQGFFESILGKGSIEKADREKGRFRTFIITMLTRYLANEWESSQRIKRGGGLAFVSLQAGEAENHSPIEPATSRTPEDDYERRWAETLIDKAIAKLAEDYRAAGYYDRFTVLKVFLVDLRGTVSISDAAARLGLTDAATKSAVNRLRRDYRESIREEIAQTVSSPDQIDEELRHLFSSLSGG